MKFNQVFLQLQAVSVIHTVTVLGRYSLDSKCDTHSDSGQNTIMEKLSPRKAATPVMI